jgi:glycosyltransferase involved in cell wall biosynthesis
MIHKGLDLVIEVFSKRNDVNLNICSPLELEERFFEIYKDKLSKNNIKYHGFISIKSKIFKEMMSENSFIILPSCSEAIPTSVVNCVANGGLIPILSKEASIDIDEKSILVKEISIYEIEKSIDIALRLNTSVIENNSKSILKSVRENYNIDTYEKRIEDILKKYCEM